MFACPICEGKDFIRLEGYCRDDNSVYPVQCTNCRHVTLSNCDRYDARLFKTGRKNFSSEIKRQLLRDNIRRYKYFLSAINNNCILDVGSGDGGFLFLAKNIAAECVAIDINREYENDYAKMSIPFYRSSADLQNEDHFDFISFFLVISHIKNPINFVSSFLPYLKKGGKIIIETQNVDDALITEYRSQEFQRFIYYYNQLHYFTCESLELLLIKAGCKNIKIYGIQRYPLANHIYWLINKKPGGHEKLESLNDEMLKIAYETRLKQLGITDTLIAECTL